MPLPLPGNKVIIGWLTLREGSEIEFDTLSRPYIALCRAEPECRYFEMLRTREDPLLVVVSECFVSEQAHAEHLQKPHFQAFWKALHKIALRGRFENVIAKGISPDAYDFTQARPV